MELTMPRISLSLAVLVAALCVADATNYIAFPRMGRSAGKFIAFPRMGRSGLKADSDSGCCGIGLKNEFVVGQNGKESFRSLCRGVDACCEGLREVFAEKPTGSFYTMCIPDLPEAASSPVLNKLKDLLRK